MLSPSPPSRLGMPRSGADEELRLVQDQEGGFLPARCSVLACQAWKGLGA